MTLELQLWTGKSLDRAEQPTGWGIIDAAIVAAVWYTGTIVLLDLSMFAIYSSPSLHSTLRFYQVDPIAAQPCGTFRRDSVCGTSRDVDRPQAEDRQLSREHSVALQ